MRQPIIAGNWKMYNTIAETTELIQGIIESTRNITAVEIVVAPTFTALGAARELLLNSAIKIAAQNVHFEESGAFTGEISPAMLKEIGCDYVILGHSERRAYYNETNETVNRKIFAALKHELLPIVCLGESESQRDSGIMRQVITEQVTASLAGLSNEAMRSIVVAYEPIWAIGTGKTATPEQAQEVHSLIRRLLSEQFDADTAAAVRIQYGGSVKPQNAASLMGQPDIDGALVGGASLQADSFSEIIKTTASL